MKNNFLPATRRFHRGGIGKVGADETNSGTFKRVTGGSVASDYGDAPALGVETAGESATEKAGAPGYQCVA